MKRSDLVPGTKYALITRHASKGGTRRTGIPDVDVWTYLGPELPTIKPTRKGQVLVYQRWGHEPSLRIRLVLPSDIHCTEEDYDKLTEAYDEKERLREAVNQKAAAYLTEHLETLYTYREVAFDAERGWFRVSPKVMAELHGLPVPGGVEVEDIPEILKEKKNVA